jgi:thiol-disulfide isomerase/thioredoxin
VWAGYAQNVWTTPESYEVDVTESKKQISYPGWLRLAFATLLVGVVAHAVVVAEKKQAPTRTAFEFAYEDTNPKSKSFGEKISLHDLYEREGVVLNFIASWCPPCWQEVPSFVKLDGEVSTPVIFIAADEHDGKRDLLVRLNQVEVSQPVLLVPPNEIAKFEQYYDHEMLPSTYLIGKQGAILQVFQGMISENTLTRALSRHLPESGAVAAPAKTRSSAGAIAF